MVGEEIIRLRSVRGFSLMVDESSEDPDQFEVIAKVLIA